MRRSALRSFTEGNEENKDRKFLSYLFSFLFKIRLARSHWAALIKKVYEVAPLLCPRCGEQMRIIAMIEKRDQARRQQSCGGQADVIEKILKHCNLWKEPESRAPPTCPHHPVFPGCSIA